MEYNWNVGKFFDNDLERKKTFIHKSCTQQYNNIITHTHIKKNKKKHKLNKCMRRGTLPSTSLYEKP